MGAKIGTGTGIETSKIAEGEAKVKVKIEESKLHMKVSKRCGQHLSACRTF